MAGTTADDAPLDEVDGDALARRLTALARAGHVDSPQWDAVQSELARRRVEHARRTPAPASESLRTQLLALLATAPGSAPSQLADTLARSTTVVSRVLTTLLAAGLVEFTTDPDDKRVRHYSLTSAVPTDGDVAPPSATEEERHYLGLVVAAAVRARRRKNDLAYAVDRLQRVLTQASESKSDGVALLARRELMATLRQAGRVDEIPPHLAALERIAAGDILFEPHLVAPATGCLDYELGRQDSLPTRERIEYLTAAATAFRRCAHLREAHDWSPREGWALLARAELCRKQTEFGVAVEDAKRAEAIFVAYDDTYSAAEAARIQGFCQRLRGNFAEAIAVLERAAASAGSADRCRADVLLQLGDALRCTGDLPRASALLTEAADLARALKRDRTLGFCLTALGAVTYAEGNLDDAWRLTTDAEPFLASSAPGRALNSRRRAVVARDLAVDGARVKLRESTALFEESMARYRDLRSPAGIAACCVGLGKAGRAPVDDLVDVASSGAGRLLLPMDPWVPSLVKRWADESDISDVRRVADWTYRSDKHFELTDEMAGEPRVRSGLLAA